MVKRGGEERWKSEVGGEVEGEVEDRGGGQRWRTEVQERGDEERCG